MVVQNTNNTISSQPGTAWNSKCLVNAEKEKEFLDLFPVVVNDLTNNTIDPHFAEANTRYDELLRYLTPFGKKLRAFITFIAYEVLEKPENVTPENRKLAMIMAWALELRDVKPPLGVEIWECGEENLELETRRFLNSIAAVLELHSASLIADDIIDEGVMRRGSFCWHRKENIGFKATNDALLLEQGTYILLRKYFKNHHCYLPSMLLFHDITLRIGMGQAADCMSVKDGKSQLQLFTMDRFKCIAEHKTGFYTFYLPIALAMYMANIYDMELHRKSEDLSKDLTFLYQVQDDFMDCYGNPETSGKKGTNIQEGKCTWLAVMAMKKANHYQIETLKQCYGSKDPEASDSSAARIQADAATGPEEVSKLRSKSLEVEVANTQFEKELDRRNMD
ncbi:farnesyl pyrophosphate synthase-like [Zophobas morio]|uniref:farnesyl pyrophosphate synthase-like n=1 Tax=Zophobas morio TaxID=2755281 RepID=UPI00308393B1